MSGDHDLRVDARLAPDILTRGGQILVGAGLAREGLAEGLDVAELGLPVVVFDETGRLSSLDQARGRAPRGETVRIGAIPHDVVAIIGGPQEHEAVEALRALFAHHDARPMPQTRSLGDAPQDWARALGRWLPQVLGARLGALQALTGAREAEIARLRIETEWRALQLRTGREMVEAIGYATRLLAFEATPGARDIGPAGTHAPTETRLAATSLIERLPVDAAGLTGLSLYANTTDDPGDGHIVIAVTDPVGGTLARAEIAYRDVAPGWNDVLFSDAIGPLHGDAHCVIAWFGTGGAAPRFALSDREVSRFGLVTPPIEATLALRAWKGLSTEAFRPEPEVPRLERHALTGAALREATHYLFGAAERAMARQRHGSDPLALADEGHLTLKATDALTGARLADALPRGTHGARVTVSVPLASPAPLTLALLPLSRAETDDPDALREMLDARLGVDAHNAPWPARTLAPGERAEIALAFDAPLAEPYALGLVLSASDAAPTTNDEADTEPTVRDRHASASISAITIETERPRRALTPFARRIPFPEMKSRTGYLFGAGEGLRATEFMGFSVLDVSDVEGFMQTHPLPDESPLGDLAGARVTGILPLGLTRVSARVVTAHPQGPMAEYGLLAVPVSAGLDDPIGFREALEASVKGGKRLPDGVIARSAIQVEPGRTADLTLDCEPLDEPADLLCTIRSLSGHTNFAWCRWTSLAVTVSPGASTVHRAEPPRQAR